MDVIADVAVLGLDTLILQHLPIERWQIGNRPKFYVDIVDTSDRDPVTDELSDANGKVR
jgi:hypothetical protein